MGPFWLKGLRMKNFRSFPEASIKFERDGLTLLKGHNLDTGGSSYAGKTTIPLAISYALGFLPFSAKDQKRWGSEGPMFVELDIGTEEGQATIRVGDKPWLKLPGDRKITSSTAIKEELSRFLKVNPDVLAALTYQQQGEKSRFLSKTDSEKKEFLSNVMPWLVKIEQAAETSDTKAKDIDAGLEGDRRFIEQLKSMLVSVVINEPVLVYPEFLTKKTIEEHEAGVAAIDQQILEVQDKLVLVDSLKHAIGASVWEQPQTEAKKRLHKAESDEQLRFQEHHLEGRKMSQVLSQATAIAAAIPKFENEIRAMEASTCPTCGQSWNTAAQRLVTTKAALAVAIETKERLPGMIQGQNEHVFVPDPKVASMKDLVANFEARISLDNLKGQEADKDRYESSLNYRNKLFQLQSERGRLTGQINDIKHGLEMTRTENARRQHDFEMAIRQRNDLTGRLQVAVDAAASREAALKAEKDFQALVGRSGFLGSIFGEVLAEITDEANLILASVANTAHVTINFLSEVSTLKGKLNKEIRPIIQISGHSADLKSGASGGMGTSIGLAVDLAVAIVVSRRTNTWPGWLIIDESFEGLDQTSKESCLEILRKHACNRLIVVVDHASETRELFSNFIEVEFSNGVSRVL